MIEQKQANNISKVIGCVFIFFGFVMFCIGLPFLTIENRNEFENTIMALSLISAVLMLVGGYQNIKKAKQKDIEVREYEEQVKMQMSAIHHQLAASTDKPAETSEVYKPDIIANWNYTSDEWKIMTKEETTRRLKEGIWVSLGIGLLGGGVLSLSRGTTFLWGFIFSLCIGVFISWLKVLISNSIFKIRKSNSIIITTNALIINSKFKTIQDDVMNLEYVKPLKIKDDSFLEFSLQWKTSKGVVTNDQFRILVPPQYENDIQKVLDYYGAKGVRT